MKKLISILLALFLTAIITGVDAAPFVVNNINITGGVVTHLDTPLSYTNGGTGTAIGPNIAQRTIYVSTAGLDSNDGLSPFTPKLTLQNAVDTLPSGGTVDVGSGTYTLASTLQMRANVKLACSAGTVITQANGSNLGAIISMALNTANGSTITGCIIDGNRSGNTDNANDLIIYVFNASDVSIENNIIRNANGSAIGIANGLRPKILKNTISNFFVSGFYVVASTLQTQTDGWINDNTFLSPIGQHAIIVNNSDNNHIEGNTIIASIQTGTRVNTSGTTVTWVSGTNFANLSPGQFITLNSGSEFLITAVNSSTFLTVNSTPGTLSNVLAVMGPGDLISIGAASFTSIQRNTIISGGAGGIVISNFIAGESTQKTLIANNILKGQAQSCIGVESESAFGTQVFDTQIIGNNISDCGLGTGAVATNSIFGITLIDFNPTSLLNTFIDGNYIRDDQGSPTTSAGINVFGVSVGQVFVGNNVNKGTLNIGVAGAINSVTLGAGFGSTGSASAAVSYGNSLTVTATANGTGISATNFFVTINTVATKTEINPQWMCVMTTTSGNNIFPVTIISSTPSLLQLGNVGTPVAGNSYTYVCK